MAPRKKPDDTSECPTIEQQDWDAVKGAKILPDGGPGNGDEKGGDLPEENDDNAYQDSDEALPDDEEERAISRNPSKQDIDEP
ncbi:hypothetical protein [Mesorhizobium sp.]|uniref:hypothetical protein n=1 Tax=Mesorhizobium sp. TaxID=1871066 RepID=UPI00120F3F56|nr:hypothetical protein [Mesorhizobium sp.]TIS55070.1 MAG: hypothetical protein E5W91_24030 [Mesorhizobium sp.]TIS92938.1 MAG: hypothetical protein E5W89_01090 [Mesorhizobium sp.]